MPADALVRDEREVSVSGSGTLMGYFHESRSHVDVMADLSRLAQTSGVLDFYARMVQKYNALPTLGHHSHERPREINSF